MHQTPLLPPTDAFLSHPTRFVFSFHTYNFESQVTHRYGIHPVPAHPVDPQNPPPPRARPVFVDEGLSFSYGLAGEYGNVGKYHTGQRSLAKGGCRVMRFHKGERREESCAPLYRFPRVGVLLRPGGKERTGPPGCPDPAWFAVGK